MTFGVQDVESVLLILVAVFEGAAGVTFGIPAFHGELHAGYWWVAAIAIVFATGVLGGALRLRASHIASEDNKLARHAESVSIAGATGAVAGRDHSVTATHLVIAAAVLFSLGAFAGAYVRIRPI